MSKNINYIDISTDYYFTKSHTTTNNMTTNDLIEIDSNIKNKDPLKNIATIELMIKLIANKNIEHIREILEIDKDNKKIINLNDKDHETLLHFSIFSDSYELSRLFLKYGADPNKRDNDGQTPLFRIVFATDEKIIGLLLEYGAILDVQDNDGNTPLHMAVLMKNYKMIKSLLDYGINPLIQNQNNLLSSDFAIFKTGDKLILDEKILAIFSEYLN